MYNIIAFNPQVNKKNFDENFKKIKFNFVILCLISSSFIAYAQNTIVGNKSFVHLEKMDNVWWFVDGNGEKFV